ncbi:hypothetical protein ACFL1H_04805 [Nanoarchaeota archaeon]
MIDPIKRALILRETLKNNSKILVVDFSNTLQGKDTSKVIDTMPNIYTDEYVFRTKVNAKEIDPIASDVYEKNFFNIQNKSDDEIEKFIKKLEFDFPLWYKKNPDFKMKNVHDYNTPFIMQVAGCNFHDGTEKGGCWYCFVDDKSNNGLVEEGKTFLSSDQTIDSFISAKEKINKVYQKHGLDVNIKVLRVSGGEPSLVLDWILNLWRGVQDSCLDLVGQIDTNLSTGLLIDHFEKEGIYEKNILNKLAEYPIKVLTAIKGIDNENIQNNVQAKTDIEQQLYSLKKIIKAGFDIYPQMYNPYPPELENYLKEMDDEIVDFSLKIHIGPLKIYSPTKQRLSIEAKNKNIEPETLIKLKQKDWDINYNDSCEILNNYLNKRYGVDYKEIVRSDVFLKLK